MKLKLNSAPKSRGSIFAWLRLPKLIGPASAANHPGIDRCLGFMAQNFHEPIQLKDLVKVSGMSRRGFCKAFNRYVGANPGAVLRHVRIEYAKQILVEHDLVLKQVAKQCGYRSENTFCVAFQSVMGTSPKRLQRNYWLSIYRNRQHGEIQPRADFWMTSEYSTGADMAKPKSRNCDGGLHSIGPFAEFS
jgi:AraC-like DNA-binding protein